MIRFDKIKKTKEKTYFFFSGSYCRDLVWCLKEGGITDFEIVRAGEDHTYDGKLPMDVDVVPVIVPNRAYKTIMFAPVLISNLDIDGLSKAMNEIYKGWDEDLRAFRQHARDVATENWKKSEEAKTIDRDIVMRKFEKLYQIIKDIEPGGTIYEVAQDSGFLSAHEYMEKWMNRRDGNVEIWLYSKDEEETFLKSIGIQNISAWTINDYTFLGDGGRYAFLVQTPLETVYVMPDIYATRQAIRTYYAEQLIRKTINPRFFVERIEETDEAVLSNMETLIPQVFPEHWLSSYKEGTMPSSYQKMVYQSCYIRYYYEAIHRQIWEELYWIEYYVTKMPECVPLGNGIHEVLEAYEAKTEYSLNDGERALVFCLNQADIETCFVEKCDGKLLYLTDTYKVDLKEYSKEADIRLIEKMKDVVDFESLKDVFGICEEDEKNKNAFADFYSSLERIKRAFIRNDEAVVSFKNMWMETSGTMTREEYRECMIPLYQVCTDAVHEVQREYSIDTFSRIYLAGAKSDDISLWEYLEKQYRAEVCILV